MYEVNIKLSSTKKCAFCKHWYDPCNSAINPKRPNQGIWEYDNSIRNMCLLKNTTYKAGEFCKYFELKL